MRWLAAMAVLAVASTTASAERFPEARGGGFQTLSPEELEAIDVTKVATRRLELDQAIVSTKSPAARVPLFVERADGHAARAISEQFAAQRLLADMRTTGQQRVTAFRARAAHLTTARDAFRSANADYLAVFCSPETISAGTSCAKPPWRVSDGVLWCFAYALRQDGRIQDAARVLRRLLHDHPTSKHAMEARLDIGDSQYVAGNHAAAIDDFAVVARSNAPAKLRVFALYRLAWSELQLQRAADAFVTFAMAIALDPHNEQIRTEIIGAAAEHLEAANAYAELERVAPSHGIDLTSTLASRWGFSGRVDKSLQLHRELLRRAPHDRRACDWQHMVVTHVNAAVLSRSTPNNDPLMLFVEIERLVEIDRRSRMFADEQADRCAAIAKNTIRSLVPAYAKNRDPNVHSLARSLFALFLRAYGDDAAAVNALLRSLG